MVYKIDSDGATVGFEWTNGNPSLGIKATLIDAAWMNMVQRELANVVESAGLTLNKLDDTQLLQSINLINASQSQTDVRSASVLQWDGSKIYFTDDIEISYRSGAGERRILKLTAASCPVVGEISLADGEVVIVGKDNQSASPVTLAYQAIYSNLVAGEWAIVPESSLTTDNISFEMILFARRDVTPEFHYGNTQKTLSIVPLGHKYFDDSVFNIGDTTNILREYSDIYQQGCNNGNMQISQRGNFTTAITAPSLGSSLWYLDEWQVVTTSGTSASLRKTSVSITNTKLTNAQKFILNTSGGALVRRGALFQSIRDVNRYAGRTVTFSFWARSNQATNCRIFHDTNLGNAHIEIDTGGGDEVWRRYHYTLKLSASVTSMRFGLGLFDAGFATYSVPAGAYWEFTGARFHVGSDHMPEHYLSLQEDFRRCMPYCQGNISEGSFNPGYSIYNINGVAKTTWSTGAPGIEYRAFGERIQIEDVGAVGQSRELLPVSLEKVGTKNVYAFDNQATTNGGLNASGRVSTKNSSGVDTTNITPSLLTVTGLNTLVVEQATTIGEGILEASFIIESLS